MSIPSTTATPWVIQPNQEARFLPEGPRAVVVQHREAVAWVNIQTAPDATTGTLYVRFWDDGSVRAVPQPQRPGFMFPTTHTDTVFVGRGKELGTVNLVTGAWEAYGTIDDANPRTIINDGEIVPGGEAIVFGTKDVQFAEPLANLYLFTLADRRCTILADRQTCSNGKVFRQEGHNLRLYDIDTPTRTVVRYTLDVQERCVRDPWIALDLQATEGFPDGMTDVGDGTVIIAFYHPTSTDAGHARRYDLSSGALLEEWRLPGSPRVTCPLLAQRPAGVSLICTTATEGMTEAMFEQCPHAGDLFIAPTTLATAPAVERVLLRG